MEEQKRIEQFLSVPGSGSGYGSGSGSGYGDGSGYGSGSGDGDGSGDGYDDGYGDGSGDGDGNGYGDGDGYGDGSGSGYGDGYGYGTAMLAGYGYGKGSGDGSGDGYGSYDGDGYGSYDGYGYGSGDGYGISTLNGEHVYQIDDVPTLIDSVSGNFAKGRILRSNLTTRPCYIAKVGKFFAHGDTLREAMADAQAKYNAHRPLAERIADFNREFPDRDVEVDAARLFEWHHILTGSCLAGRKAFCEDRGLDYEHGHYTVNEFIRLTREAYGGEAIQELEKTLP